MTAPLVRAVQKSDGQAVAATLGATGACPIPGYRTIGQLLGLRAAKIRELLHASRKEEPVEIDRRLLSPVDGRCEVWAAGVTYERSRTARVEESESADVYDRVYEAARPEIFFKAPAWRVVTNGDPIGVRSDSANNTAEPELGVVANAHGERVGYVIVNDMSSRSIEGENPLYLPQAKIYDASCAMSSTIFPAWTVADVDDLAIKMTVARGSDVIFDGRASTARLKRSIDDLLEYLFHSMTFPEGVVLSTGTSVVPPLSLSTQAGDVVTISITGLGTLRNHVLPTDRVTGRLGDLPNRLAARFNETPQ